MATRPKKKKKKVVPNKENTRKIRYLNTELGYSLRAITGLSEGVDIVFKDQALKIQAQIDKLEKNQ